MAAHQAARLGNVLGPLHERQRDPVGIVLDRKRKVAAVLFGQRRHGHDRIGHVHALAVRDHAADFGRAQDFVVVGADHAKAQLAIIDQQALALLQDAEQFGMRQAHARFVAGFRIAVEREVARMANHRTAFLECADAQLWPLQVAQHRYRATNPLFQRADRGNGFGVGGVIAMAHVHAESIGPGAEQLFKHFGRAAGRAHRGKDLDLAATNELGARIEFGHDCILLFGLSALWPMPCKNPRDHDSAYESTPQCSYGRR